MTQEQEDALVGSVAREKAEAERHLRLLQADASRIGHELIRLGRLLSKNPEGVHFDGQSFKAKYEGEDPFNVRGEDVERLIKLTDEIRETMERLDELRERAAKLGI